MSTTIVSNTDEEMDRYEEAALIINNPPPMEFIKNKKLAYNRYTKQNDVLVPLTKGGYVKLGQEPLERSEQVKEYAKSLQNMGMPFDIADFEAAGFAADEVDAAGIMPQTLEQPKRTEPMQQDEQLFLQRSGVDLLQSRPGSRYITGDRSIREGLTDYTYMNGEGELRQIFQALGLDEFEARQFAEGIFGNPNATRDLGLGIADFTPLGLFFGAQEGMETYQKGIQAGDELEAAFGALEAGVSFLEALPVTAAASKGLKANLPKLKGALQDIKERLNQPGQMPTLGSNLGNVGQQTQLATSNDLPGRISTRLPTAKQIDEDPMSGELIIGLEEMKKDPKLFDFNVSITKDYPNMRSVNEETIDATSERFIEHVKDNLLYLHDQVPDATRARSQKWYDGARAITDRWSQEYNVPDTSIAGVLAGLSPQKDWYQNVSLAERTLEVATKQKDFKFTKEMQKTFVNLPALNKPKYKPMLDAIKNKSYAEIVDENPAIQATLRAMFVRLYDQTYNKPDYKIVSPEGEFLEIATNADGTPSKAAWGSLNEISKAVASIDAAGDVNTISRLMGERHKVRNFYNNIYDPNSSFGDVTIDTHAVAAGLLRPLSGNSLEVDHNFKNQAIKGRGTTKGSAKTGVSGNYGLYAEAYRRAAAERGILPRQMQSITWEAVRGLFPDTFKASAKNVADIDAIWQKYKKGDIELDETRRMVNERANGVNPPSWE